MTICLSAAARGLEASAELFARRLFYEAIELLRVCSSIPLQVENSSWLAKVASPGRPMVVPAPAARLTTIAPRDPEFWLVSLAERPMGNSQPAQPDGRFLA